MVKLNLFRVAVVALIASMASFFCWDKKREEKSINHIGVNRRVLYLLFVCSVIIPYSCKKTSIEHEAKPELLVNGLGIALAKGGTQTIIVSPYDKYGNIESYTVTCKDATIATVSILDTTFTVRGVNYGTTAITVTSASGESAKIPVRIYDFQVLETEELLISFSQTFQIRYRNFGYGSPMNASFWHPVTTNGFKALGSLGSAGDYDPNGKQGAIMVKARSGSNALAAPVDYTLLFSDQNLLLSRNGSLWIPVPPAGYKAMGIVAQIGYSKPNLEDVVCVREDLTIPGEAGNLIVEASNLFEQETFSSWIIEPPIAEPHENAYLSTGTFVALSARVDKTGPGKIDKPSVNSVMNVLNVKLPLLVETPYQEYVPSLKGYDPPPDETVPILSREMLVPCTILNDPFYANDQMWRVTNSPFYRLERQVFYKLLYHNHNKTSLIQHNSYTRSIGVTTTESNEFWNETAISVTVEGGISIKMFNAKVSATISKSFGYSSLTSIAELKQAEDQSGVDASPGKAVAIWQRYNRFVLKRHNGTLLEPVKAWEFGINSFVTDEYPH